MAHAGERAETPAQSARRAGGSALRETAIIVVVALALSVLTRIFLVQAFFVPSASMVPTLKVDDRIIASKLTTRLGGVSRGEVVVFRDPGGWLPEPVAATGVSATIKNVMTFIGLLPSDTGQDLVKRVIGIGGDRVVCCSADGKITVNGVALKEPYINGEQGTEQVRFDVRVPVDRVFVMGDNRPNSEDSRYHLSDGAQGTVPVENVVGRVVLKVWPLSSFGTVPIPDTFGDPALDKKKPVVPQPVPGTTSGS